jgi:protein Tex
VVKAGDVVSVRVKEVDIDRKRIALSMKREVPGIQGAHGSSAKPSGGDKGKPAPRGGQPMSAGRAETRPEDSPFAALAKLKKQ